MDGIDKMREEFESWIEGLFSLPAGSLKKARTVTPTGIDGYADIDEDGVVGDVPCVELCLAFDAWKASRAAIEAVGIQVKP